MRPSDSRDYKIEPESLGPLGERPLVEMARSGSPEDLFPGASAFLAPRHQKARREQWNAAMPLAKRLLRPEERILHVAHAMQVPPVLHAVALGAMALPYHQAVLLFTDTRLIEILMRVRGKRADTRVRSFPWAGVRDAKVTFTRMRIVPAEGRKQEWRVPLRGDRNLIKLLLPRLKTLFLQGGAATQTLPLWHCPQCGATVPVHPRSCASCRTEFRSLKLATVLSIAFPGAGLFYAGHPFLAIMDGLGEAVFYVLFLVMMLQAEPGAIPAAVGLGAFLFILTKLESVHLSRILVARTRPETESRRSGYTRLALAGGLASLILIGGAFPLAGAARPRLDRDLDVAGEDGSWQGTRNAADWGTFAADATARSRWEHSGGLQVMLFAYPQGMMETPGDFRDQFRQAWHQEGVTVVKDDEDLPPPFEGFRFIGISRGEDGQTISMIQYFIVDGPNQDIHHASAAVLGEDADPADEIVRDMLSHARWIAPVPPERSTQGTSE